MKNGRHQKLWPRKSIAPKLDSSHKYIYIYCNTFYPIFCSQSPREHFLFLFLVALRYHYISSTMRLYNFEYLCTTMFLYYNASTKHGIIMLTLYSDIGEKKKLMIEIWWMLYVLFLVTGHDGDGSVNGSAHGDDDDNGYHYNNHSSNSSSSRATATVTAKQFYYIHMHT